MSMMRRQNRRGRMVGTWTDIPGYGGKYQVDKEGNVRRVYLSGRTRALSPYHRKMSGS